MTLIEVRRECFGGLTAPPLSVSIDLFQAYDSQPVRPLAERRSSISSTPLVSPVSVFAKCGFAAAPRRC